MNNLHKEHNFIKFEYKISQTRIKFLDKKVSIQNNKLVTTICRNTTNRQKFCHVDSDHPKSLKHSIPYSQTLKIKQICTTPNDFVRSSNTAQRMKFSIKDFFSNCDQIRSFLRILLHLLKKSLMGKLHFQFSETEIFQSSLQTRANKKTYKSSTTNGQGRTFKRKRQYHLKRNKNSAVLTYNRSLPNISKAIRKH